MKVLDNKEKLIYDSMLKGVKFKKLECWKQKAPDDFENHTPRNLSEFH